MKAEVVAKFAVWFVIFIILLTLGLEMISAPNIIENVIGFFMVVAILYLSYVQTIDYEPFTINAKDGSEFTVDPTVSLKIIDGKSPAVFKKYRKELNEVIRGTLYNYVKDAFRIQLNKFTTDDIVSKLVILSQTYV